MNSSHASRIFLLTGIVVSLGLVFFLDCAWAADQSMVLDNINKQFHAAAAPWGEKILVFAQRLFLGIAVIYLVYSSGMVLLEGGGEFQKFFAHLIKISIFFGFYYFLLESGLTIAETIINSMIELSSIATGTGATSASEFMTVAFALFYKILENLSVWEPATSLVACIVAVILLILLALIAANLTIEYCAAWVLLYGGVFFLGFGATPWTSDMAINYFKAVLGCAVRIFSMLLILGVGASIINTTITPMTSGSVKMEDYGVLLVYAIILFAIMNKVPSLLSNMVGGGSGVSSLGLGAIMGVAGLGAGAAMGAAAAAGAVGGLAPNQSSVREAITNSMRGMSESSSAPPASSINSPTEGQSAGTPLSNAMGLDNKNAAPADPKGGASGSFSGGKSVGGKALDYMTQGSRELGADLEKGGG
jgi:type IV secretion system protein VirB6/type IV secretion system protein TrbL